MSQTPNTTSICVDRSISVDCSIPVDWSTRTNSNNFAKPNNDAIPSGFLTCCGNPTKLILAPNSFNRGFWIVTCHSNTIDPDEQIVLECPSFMVPKPNITQRRCSICHADCELLQTYGTATIGHWYWKCPNRNMHDKDHLLLMVTCDTHEAQRIKSGQKQILPVSHIIKNGFFTKVEEARLLNDIKSPNPLATPTTIRSGYSTPPRQNLAIQSYTPSPTIMLPTQIQNNQCQVSTDQIGTFGAKLETVMTQDPDDSVPPSPCPTDPAQIEIEDPDNSVPPSIEDQTCIKTEYQGDDQIHGKGKEKVSTIDKEEYSPPSTRTRYQTQRKNDTRNKAQSDEETRQPPMETQGQSSNRVPSPSPVASPLDTLPERESDDHGPEEMDFESNEIQGSFRSLIEFHGRSQTALLSHSDPAVRSQVMKQLEDVNLLFGQYLNAVTSVSRISRRPRHHSRARRVSASPYPENTSSRRH